MGSGRRKMMMGLRMPWDGIGGWLCWNGSVHTLDFSVTWWQCLVGLRQRSQCQQERQSKKCFRFLGVLGREMPCPA